MSAADRLSDLHLAEIADPDQHYRYQFQSLAREVQHYRTVEARLRELHGPKYDDQPETWWTIADLRHPIRKARQR